jgi:hypothetical protein
MLCILCISSMEEFSLSHVDVEPSLYPLYLFCQEFSLSHVDVEACLYPLYLFYGGILSKSCGR